MPKIQSLPNLRQLTVKLSNPQTNEIIELVKFLSSFNVIKFYDCCSHHSPPPPHLRIIKRKARTHQTIDARGCIANSTSLWQRWICRTSGRRRSLSARWLETSSGHLEFALQNVAKWVEGNWTDGDVIEQRVEVDFKQWVAIISICVTCNILELA